MPPSLLDTPPEGDKKSLSFLDLPLEVRLKIYEEVLTCHDSICPGKLWYQSASTYIFDPEEVAHAKYSLRRYPHVDLGFTRRELETDLSLSLVCREIRANLRDNPVFYQTNRFVFRRECDLEEYLADITPYKRAAIRKIELCDDQCIIRRSPLLELLSQCTAIKEFSLVFRIDTESEKSFARTPAELEMWLDKLVAASGNPRLLDYDELPRDTIFLWALPFVRPIVDFEHFWTVMRPRVNPRHVIGRMDVGLSNEIPETKWPLCYPKGSKFREVVTKLNELVFQHRHFIRQSGEHNHSQWLGKGDPVEDGFEKFPIYLPREFRFHGPISTRTRSKLKPTRFSDELREPYYDADRAMRPEIRRRFIINYVRDEYQPPYYDSDGVVTPEIERVRSVEWEGESEIKCTVLMDDNIIRTEPLRAILNHTGYHELGAFYLRYLEIRRREKDNRCEILRIKLDKLKSLQEIPSPRDVYKLGDMEMVVPTTADNARTLMPLQGWAKLISDWEDTIDDLEKAIKRQRREYEKRRRIQEARARQEAREREKRRERRRERDQFLHPWEL